MVQFRQRIFSLPKSHHIEKNLYFNIKIADDANLIPLILKIVKNQSKIFLIFIMIKIKEHFTLKITIKLCSVNAFLET